jgi:hypothetical protein
MANLCSPWTMVHSFYAGMGGFAFDISIPAKAHQPDFIPCLRRLHLTPRGILLLAKCGLLPTVSKEEILDKSKTDGTGKTICCIQVGWMLVQAVTRLAVGLPITPLEINTIAHVACALMNYVLWWHKPKWVNEPIILQGDWTRAICAFMYMSSQVSAEQKTERALLRNFRIQPEIASVLYLPNTKSTCHNNSQLEVNPESGSSDTTLGNQISTDSEQTPPGNHYLGKEYMFVSKDSAVDARHSISSDYPVREPGHVMLENLQQSRWKLASEAIARYPALQQRLTRPERNSAELHFREALNLYPNMPDNVREKFIRHIEEGTTHMIQSNEEMVIAPEELVVDYPRNWPGDDLMRELQGNMMGMVMWVASTVYGAIHLAGWKDSFPTTVEMWFWRISAAYIVFSGLLWAFLNMLDFLSGSVWIYWYEILAGHVRRKSHTLIYGLCVLGGSLYVIARTFLVVEAFISLRALPAAAYNSPSWILTVPHL